VAVLSKGQPGRGWISNSHKTYYGIYLDTQEAAKVRRFRRCGARLIWRRASNDFEIGSPWPDINFNNYKGLCGLFECRHELALAGFTDVCGIVLVDQHAWRDRAAQSSILKA
jgi:hypothetical protein